MSTSISLPSIMPGEGFNALMGAAYNEFLLNQQRNAQAFEIWKRSREQREEAGQLDLRERDLAYKQARQAAQSRQAAGPKKAPARPPAPVGRETPMRSLMTTKAALDAMQSRDPWAGQGYGQVTGRDYFNLPAAQAIETGQQFPSGFDAYAALMNAGRSVNPLVGAYGTNTSWGQGY